MSSPKQLPISKTVVSEVRVQVADQFVRTNLMKFSIAANIPEGDITSADVTITNTKVVSLTDIHKLIIAYSYEPFLVTIGSGVGPGISFTSSGLFIFYGEMTELTLTGLADTPTRLTYIYG